MDRDFWRVAVSATVLRVPVNQGGPCVRVESQMRPLRPGGECATLASVAPMESNRRREPRQRRRLSVSLRLASLSGWTDLGDQALACAARDISAHGLRLAVNLPLAVGTRLEVRINTGEAFPLCMHGEVRWRSSGGTANDHRIGIEFLDNPAEVAAAWAAFVESAIQPRLDTPTA